MGYWRSEDREEKLGMKVQSDHIVIDSILRATSLYMAYV